MKNGADRQKGLFRELYWRLAETTGSAVVGRVGCRRPGCQSAGEGSTYEELASEAAVPRARANEGKRWRREGDR